MQTLYSMAHLEIANEVLGRVNKIKKCQSGETNILTKVVTQFVQFLSDNRTGDTLLDQNGAIDEEDIELTEVA